MSICHPFVWAVIRGQSSRPISSMRSTERKRFNADLFVDLDLVLLFDQRFERVFECDLVHVRAAHTAQTQAFLFRD